MEKIKSFIYALMGQNSAELEFFNKIDGAKVDSQEIISASVKKFRKQYMVILCLISFFEVMLIIRGFLYFDFTKIRRCLYMVCYFSLLLFSVAGLFTMKNSMKRNTVTPTHIKIVYAYCIFLTVFSAAISILDAFGGHTPIVFMTVIMGTAALAFIHPVIFIILGTCLSVAVVSFCRSYGPEVISGSGYLINFGIFIIFTFFIIIRQYGQNKRDYCVMKKLESLSYHDQLTGLHNRFALQNDIEQAKGMVYFGIFDFDNFKNINDTYGHDFGDKCLQRVAQLMQEQFGEHSYRYGGDEFVVFSNERKDEVREHCEYINAVLAKEYTDIKVQLSGGFYLAKSSRDTYTDFLRYSDRALYTAKHEKKGTFVFYE